MKARCLVVVLLTMSIQFARGAEMPAVILGADNQVPRRECDLYRRGSIDA
jgi:hypothetical protein